MGSCPEGCTSEGFPLETPILAPILLRASLKESQLRGSLEESPQWSDHTGFGVGLEAI